jgi:hypothetical protein
MVSKTVAVNVPCLPLVCRRLQGRVPGPEAPGVPLANLSSPAPATQDLLGQRHQERYSRPAAQHYGLLKVMADFELRVAG